jgi:phage gp29-like protein
LDRHLFQPIVQYNFPGSQAPRVWRNFKPEENLTEAVKVDKELHAMGYTPANPAAYVADKYGGEWVHKPQAAPDPGAGFMKKLRQVAGSKAGQPVDGEAEFAETKTRDALDLATDRALASSDAALSALIAPIRKLVAESASFEELQSGLLALYGDMPIAELAEVMSLAMIAAEAAGRDEILAAARE